jgi:hypothetical protein
MMMEGQGKVRVTTCLRSTVVIAGVACGLSLAHSAVAAESPTAPTPLERSADAVPGARKYDGVVPGPTGRNPLPAAPQGGAYLVWTGFQMTANGSQVFLQTTQQVQFDSKEPRKSGHPTLAVVLRDCRIHMANNRRKIDTRYFATPVAAISAKQKGRDVEVRIALRERASLTPHNEPGPDGTQFLVLDFPPGKAAPEPSSLQDLATGADTQSPSDAEGSGAGSAGSGKVRLKAAAKSSE